jgi:hypothetical protein
MNGAGARRKGHDFERWVANELALVFGDDVRRGLQYRDGSEAPDVIAPAFFIECKRGRQTNPRAALHQAQVASAGKGLWPIAITKDDGDPPIVTLSLEDFTHLLREWWAGRQR